MLSSRFRHALLGAAALVASSACAGSPPALVLAAGRVMDPESRLDGIWWVAIDSGRITAVSEEPIGGRVVVDVSGLVVSPGFIDLHAHGQDTGSATLQALDGVTTALELEDSVYPVDDWYRSREGDAVINFGASVSHLGARLALMHGVEVRSLALNPEAVLAFGPRPDGFHRAADGTEMEELVRRMRQGLAEGRPRASG